MARHPGPWLKAVALAAFAAVGLAAVAASADEAQGPAFGQIDIVQTEGGYQIDGLVTGVEEVSITATLSIEKRDGSGSVSSTQGRQIDLRPGQTETLARSMLSVDPDGSIEAVLTLSRDGVEFERISRSVIAGQTEQQ